MKKILMILFCFLLLGCSKDQKPMTNDILKFKDEYEKLNSASVVMNVPEGKITYLNVDEAINFMENGTGILYIGFPACPWCRNIVPVLIETFKDEYIYYYNPNVNKDSVKEKQFESFLAPYLENNRLYVPDVYFVKNGKIMGHHLGSVSSQNDPYVPLTDIQKQELVDIYNNLFKEIK